MSARLDAVSGRLTGRSLGYILLGGAGAMALGMFLPWAQVTAPIVGTVSKNAIDGDGKVLLALAAAIAVGAFFYLTSRFAPGMKLLLGSAAVLSAAFMVFELIDTQRRFGDIANSLSQLKDNPFGAALSSAVSYGFGIGAFSASIGTLAVVVATVLILKNGPLTVATVTQPGLPLSASPVPVAPAP